MKTRNRKIGSLNDRIALKFDKRIDSSTGDVSVKCQSDRTVLNTNPAASRLCNILRLIGYWNMAQHFIASKICTNLTNKPFVHFFWVQIFKPFLWVSFINIRYAKSMVVCCGLGLLLCYSTQYLMICQIFGEFSLAAYDIYFVLL